MREAGDVCYADVNKDGMYLACFGLISDVVISGCYILAAGTGVCEFMRYEDMKYAVKKLDDTKFRSHEVNSSLYQEIS